MNGIFKNKKFFLYSSFFLFLILQLFNYVIPKLLNRIIKLGENNLRYGHFSFNSNGDMIVDTSAFPVNKERKFFGLKKNGRFFFKDTNGKEIPFISIYADHTKGRIEGESYFIKLTSSDSNINGRELLFGISKNEDSNPGYFAELYNLNAKNMTKYITSNILGNLIADSFTITKFPDESSSTYYYIFTYIVFNYGFYYLNIKKTYFSFDLNEGYHHVIEKQSLQVMFHRMVSCFYTKNLLYICTYLNLYYQLKIIVYNLDFSSSTESSLYESFIIYGERLFFKGIHLKEEIGFFIYFTPNVYYPTFSILQCNNDKSMTPYSNFDKINVDKTTFDNDDTRNDLIKLNDFQTCFVSCNSDRTYFKFVTFTLYKTDTLMNIRYYQIQMWPEYNIKIFCDIKAAVYKNFISIAFSNCENNVCSNPYTDEHFSSLIILSYPNSTDNSLDIIPQLYETNKNIENDFSFNFEGTLTIENNLFGYVYKGTRIMKYPIGLKLTNTTNGNILEVESVIIKDENVSLYFQNHENYEQNNYIIEYAYVLEEPSYEFLENYYYNIEVSKGNQIEDEKDYFQKYEYTGKSSDFTIIIKENLMTNCNDDSCSLCFSNYTCLTCKYNYTFNDNNKICFPKPLIPTTILTTIPSSTPNSTQCTEIEIFEGKCTGKLSSDQIKIIYNLLKGKVSTDANQLIETENVIFQLSTLEEQKNSNNPNISSIDLGDCEQLIKDQEGLTENDKLIVLKTDIKNEDLSSTYVQYEIYNPKNLKKISLDVCSDIPISVSVPFDLGENSKNIYDSLSKSGYNLFDLNDSFYNDICSTYTTEDGTDLTLSERKNLIYNNNANVSMCQDDCTFQFYNLTTKRAKCDCSPQKGETITDISKLKFDKNVLANSFFITLKNSNFLVLKCFKLVFSKKGQMKNIGSYMMSGINFIFIVLMFIYIINDNKKIEYFIEMILKEKLTYPTKNKPLMKKPVKFIKKKKINKKRRIKQVKNKQIVKLSTINNLKKSSERNTNNFPPKKTMNLSSKNNIVFKKPELSMNNLPNKAQEEKSRSITNFLETKNKGKRFRKKKGKKLLSKKNRMNKVHLYNLNSVNKTNFDNDKAKNLNDEEMNSLEYEFAVLIDKRNYFQYYISLLKKKHLILFAFYPANDYNLIAIKISLLLLSFSLYFTINGFFFSDETMNKINENKGSYNFLFQIPQILYSTVVSGIINMLLKLLSLSEKQILKIKLEKDFLIAQKKSKQINMFLKIRLTIFFILSFILMIFFWYFISCFCSVYKNTQMILIKDTLISFAISMIYPFGLNLLPGMFRIPALRAQKKDKKCLYNTSNIIALI